VTIAVLDYGAGNVTSVMRAFGAVGAVPRLAKEVDDLEESSAIVVPGVGHFAMTARIGRNWRAALTRAIDRGTPLLGICLGMQWLYEGSEEAPECEGLGIFPGRCSALSGDVKLPHVGWNVGVRSDRPSRLLDRVARSPWTYFTHTFAAPIGDETSAVTTYGRPFAASVERGLVFGTQWHPEKSGAVGRQVLESFLATVGSV
jgi:glutamine amidotransferase